MFVYVIIGIIRCNLHIWIKNCILKVIDPNRITGTESKYTPLKFITGKENSLTLHSSLQSKLARPVSNRATSSQSCSMAVQPTQYARLQERVQLYNK